MTQPEQPLHVPWEGTLVKEGVWTGDKRWFDTGSLTWGLLPIPLRWAPEDFGQHDGAEHIGWIQQIARIDDGSIDGKGYIFDPGAAAYLEECQRAGAKAGVSIDADSVEETVEIPPDMLGTDQVPEPGKEYPVLQEMTRMKEGRIRAATIVDIPAFIEAGIGITASISAPVTYAGLALQAEDTGRVLMLQRAMEDGDPAAGTWEFPGGQIDDGETPLEAAVREFQEETGLALPPGEVVDTWDSDNGVYRLHVYRTSLEINDCNPPTDQHVVPNPDGDKFEIAAWFAPGDLAEMPSLREEAKSTPWEMFDMTVPDQPSDPTAPPVDDDAGSPEDASDLTFLKAVEKSQDDLAKLASDFLAAGTDTDNDVTAFAQGLLEDLAECDPELDALIVANGGTPDESGDVPAPMESDVLIASAAPVAPPAEWFEPFELDGPTPLTITADGRVFGHLATWDSCHASSEYSGKCVRPPSDPSAEFFHLGQVMTAEGSLVAAGVVTVGGGHAARNKKIQAAIEHYDDASTAAAVVRLHEDKYGIGLFGSVTPGATPEQIATLRRHPLSGDWRKEGGKWRIIAAHGVNAPGYPILRSLVASSGPESFIVTGRVEREIAEPDLRAAADRIAKSIGRDTATLVASYAERFADVSIVAGVTGDEELPIAPYDQAWDGGKAADDVFSHYTAGDGTVDTQSVEKAFMWVDGDPQMKGSYHLPFADFVNGELQIIPAGVQACAGSHGLDAVQGLSGQDQDAVKAKICTLYSKIQAKYPDAPDCPLA